jgi:hypothetical protein
MIISQYGGFKQKHQTTGSKKGVKNIQEQASERQQQ